MTFKDNNTLFIFAATTVERRHCTSHLFIFIPNSYMKTKVNTVSVTIQCLALNILELNSVNNIHLVISCLFFL